MISSLSLSLSFQHKYRIDIVMASRKRTPSQQSQKTTHRAAYYFQEGSDGNNTWVFFLEGGGLCSHQDDCTSRSTTDLGSSKNFAKTIELPSFQSSDSSSNPDWYAETKSQHSNVQENPTTLQTGTTPIKFLFRTVQEMYVVFEREAREFQSYLFFIFQLCDSNHKNITLIILRENHSKINAAMQTQL